MSGIRNFWNILFSRKTVKQGSFCQYVLAYITMMCEALLFCVIRLDETLREKVIEQENGVNPSCHSGLCGTKNM